MKKIPLLILIFWKNWFLVYWETMTVDMAYRKTWLDRYRTRRIFRMA